MSGVVAIVAALRGVHVRPVPTDTFDNFVASFGADVVSYWKFESVSGSPAGFVDEKGVSDAILTGAPEFDVPTLVDFDTIEDGAPSDGTCIAWPGTPGEYAQAAHNSALKTDAGTIVVHFQRDTANNSGVLIRADAGSTQGGFGIQVNTNGSPEAYIRGVGGTPTTLSGGAGDVELNRAYAAVFKWGVEGLSLAIWDDSGSLVRRVTNASSIGLSGTSAIRFGASHSDTNHHDGPYGRVIWLDRRISDNEEILLARPRSVPRTGSYRQVVVGLGPIALWGLGETGGTTLVDDVGIRDGTYSGTPGFGAPELPTNSGNNAVNFGGVATASVPHDSGLNLSAFTLSFWFAVNALPTEEQVGVPIIAKNSTVQVAGEFFISLMANGGIIIFFQDGTVNHSLPVDPTFLNEGNLPNHVVVSANNTGFDAYVNGKYVSKVTTYTGAWSSGTAPITFADNPSLTLDGNITLDEVALFNRVLTEADVLLLAQKSGPPTAEDDVASVQESATTAIDVLPNDEYVGTPTLSIISQPAGGDSAAVSGQQINYTAGAVASDTARSFTYRITDPLGVSNTGTVQVTVLNATTPIVSNANCYPKNANAPSTETATSISDMVSRVNAAPAGRHVLIPAGTYTGGTFTFTSTNGTEANPIVIRPVGARGSVVINNAAWTLAAGSRRLVFKDLYFSNPAIRINGSHHRITRCRFTNLTGTACRVDAATDIRLDHWEVTSIPDDGVQGSVIYCNETNAANGSLRRVLTDYIYLHDITRLIFNNQNFRYLNMGAGNNIWNDDADIIMDHWLIQNSNNAAHGEFVVSKISGLKVRYCTFINVRGYLQQRLGGGWEVRSNWFEGTTGGVLKCFDMYAGGTQSGAGRQLVIGNRLVNGDLWVGAGNTTTGADGNYNNTAEYWRSRSGQFIGNIAPIRVGQFWSSPSPPVSHPALDNNLWNNTGTVTFVTGQHSGTTTIDPSLGTIADPPTNTSVTPWYSFTPAVRLTPSDVGMGAPDPLCPSGPQGND